MPSATPQLLPVRVVALQSPLMCDVDLYLPPDPPFPPRLYCRSGAQSRGGALERLLERGVMTLLVPRSQIADLRANFRELLDAGVDLPPPVRFEVTRETLKTGIADAWNGENVSLLAELAGDFSDRVVDTVRSDADVLEILSSLAIHDGDTYSHVTNVCTYVIVLARELGISQERELVRLGQAALLHDVGKRHVHKNILQKPGPLTDRERDVINEHPRRGFEELCEHSKLDAEQLLMVYQHHERIDGCGYPVRLSGEEICWTARICSVVDVFDALTGKRSYRDPLGAEKAGEYLTEGAGTQFHKEYVTCWTRVAKSLQLPKLTPT